MTPYEEMKELQKQISEIHTQISVHYKQMSRFGEEYHWKSVEARIELEDAKAAVLREKLEDATHRFVNWQKPKEQ